MCGEGADSAKVPKWDEEFFQGGQNRPSCSRNSAGFVLIGGKCNHFPTVNANLGKQRIFVNKILPMAWFGLVVGFLGFFFVSTTLLFSDRSSYKFSHCKKTI